MVKSPLTFFQASYRPHSSATVSDNKQLWGTREKGRDGHAHTHRQQWIPYRHTHTHTPSHSHPVVMVHHTTTPTPRPLHTVLGQQFGLPRGTTNETAENRKWEGCEAACTAGDAWVRPHTISSRPMVWRWNWKWGKVSAKRGIYHQTQSHFLLGGLSTL